MSFFQTGMAMQGRGVNVVMDVSHEFGIGTWDLVEANASVCVMCVCVLMRSRPWLKGCSIVGSKDWRDWRNRRSR